MTNVNGFQLLCVATKSFILVVAGFLDPLQFFLSSIEVRYNGYFLMIIFAIIIAKKRDIK